MSTKPDIASFVGSVPSDPYRRTVLNAVVGPFCRREDLSGLEALRRGVYRLEGVRRNRVYELAHLGWGRLSSPDALHRRLGCPPYGLGKLPDGLFPAPPCGLTAACPWCWGRNRVKPAFTALDRALRSAGPAAELVVFRNRVYGTVEPGRLVEWLWAQLEAFSSVGFRAPKRYTGAVACGWLLPLKRFPGGAERIQARFVTVRCAPGPDPLEDEGVAYMTGCRTHPVRYPCPNGDRSGLWKAVAAEFRYPASTLRLPAAHALPVLQALDACGLRLFRTKGACHSGGAPAKEKPE